MALSAFVSAQDTFEGGASPWNFTSTSIGNSFIVDTAAGSGPSIPGGIRSAYVSFDTFKIYGALNSIGACLMYRRYDNVCPHSSLHFDYRISKGIFSYGVTDTYYGQVVYSYDSITWNPLSNDTLLTPDCSLWYNKSIPFVFNQPTVYIGFLFVNNADSMSICAPLAIDNVWLMCDVSLPVTMRDFSVTYIGGVAEVNFFTESELNTDRFIVQYSYDGKEFYDLCDFQAAFISYHTIHYNKIVSFQPEARITYFKVCEVVSDNEFCMDIVCVNTSDVPGTNDIYYDILGREVTDKRIQLQISKNKKTIIIHETP